MRSGFSSNISRVASKELSVFWRILRVTIWSHIGTREVFGLQGSVVLSRGKSDVISQVSFELSHPSSKGVKMRFILQSA